MKNSKPMRVLSAVMAMSMVLDNTGMISLLAQENTEAAVEFAAVHESELAAEMPAFVEAEENVQAYNNADPGAKLPENVSVDMPYVNGQINFDALRKLIFDHVILDEKLKREDVFDKVEIRYLATAQENGTTVSAWAPLQGGKVDNTDYPAITVGNFEILIEWDGTDVWSKFDITGKVEIKCNHNDTTVEVIREAACNKEGEAEVVCNDCSEIVEVQTIDALEHETDRKNYKQATCMDEGYSGDIFCKVCNDEVEKGHVLEKLPHEAIIKNAKEATCSEEGYTGDKVCKQCDGGMELGTVIEKLPHETDRRGYVQATCMDEGFSGEIFCKVCDEVVDEGHVLEKLPHEAIIENAKDATCTEEGYTGDKVCKQCAGLMEKGQTIEKLEHTAVIVDAKEATCTEDGYTGDTVCENCGEVLEKGEVISAAGHDWDVVKFNFSVDHLEGHVDAVCKTCGEKHTFDTVAEVEDLGDELVVRYSVDMDGFQFTHERTIKKLHFVDVNPLNWYNHYVTEAFESGLMTGLNENEFGPDVEMTRAMVVTVLYRMDGNKAVEGTSGFSDVKDGLWYSDAITWAVQAGVTTGYLGDKEGTFGPDDIVTREQLCTMIMRYLNYKGVDTSARASLDGFGDAANVSFFAKDAMEFCVASGIISGAHSGTMLLPGNSATRAECAKITVQTSKIGK